jgi:hypothetical protein
MGINTRFLLGVYSFPALGTMILLDHFMIGFKEMDRPSLIYNVNA